MQAETLQNSAELNQAFAAYERQVTIQNYKIGCILGIIFMPAGSSLDYFVYHNQVGNFFLLRMGCSLLLGLVWFMLTTPPGIKYYRLLGFIEVSLPIIFISLMISHTDGFESPYYAGLNLVLMGAGLVLRWKLVESIGVLALTLGIYWVACRAHGPVLDRGVSFNNLYFLVVTGVFVNTGNYFYNLLRFREFALRFELDNNRKMLEESNRKLVELDRVKSRFFANISHELRTPLTLLLAPLESLLHQTRQAFDDQSREMLQTMHSHGLRLLKLINDLLDLVRLESGKMEVKPEPVEVTEFLYGLVNSIRHVAEDKRVRLRLDASDALGTLMLDRDKLEKILLNLIFNAIKFTPAGGQVETRAGRQEAQLVLQVSDTGMGIAAENLPFLFNRFWQADTSSQRKYQGAGIGLALVKELVEAQGGTVAAESQIGKGTCMTVQLPYIEAEAAAPATAGIGSGTVIDRPEDAAAKLETGPSEEWLTRLYRRAELIPSMPSLKESLKPAEATFDNALPKVLIADDEPDMLRFLRSQLRLHFQVLEAVDGQQAIEKAAQFLPDIILCDMMMPEKDGLEVCRELRHRTSTRNIPIVLLTARADEETKLAALSAGANDFLSKPFSMTELHVRLSNLAAAYQMQRQLARQNQVLEATLEELKDTETQLVQSEKLASLGRMSAGIIHEINNPLNYAKTGLYLLKQKDQFLPENQRADYAEIWQDITDGINRVVTIVSDLRTFTHPNAEQFEEIEAETLTSSALRFLSNELRDTVRVENQIPAHFTLEANRNKVVMVLINLLQNAVHAVKKKNYTGESPTIWLSARQETGRNLLVVRDNGVGIPAENLSKIFEPFFTTKEVGEGMGLGLSICYRLMEEHGGRISARSEYGKYCEFTLEFPRKALA